MNAGRYKEEHPIDGEGGKKTFIEPEMKEFDDLEKQIKTPLFGTFSTP